jgi:hypothetical protein
MNINWFEKIEMPFWFYTIIFVSLFVIGIVAFNTGYSFHENSINQFLEYNSGKSCWTKAFVLEAFMPFDLTSNLKQKECNSIDWLWEKRLEYGKKELLQGGETK